jgi:hypothetical protein
MLSWFALLDLREALLNPGCPICQMRRVSASRYLSVLIYESVNDVETRLKFWAGMGYCTEHTRLLTDISNENEEKPIGMNILYESLASLVKEAILESPIPTRRPNPLRMLFRHVFPRWLSEFTPGNLNPKASCRVCQVADGSVQIGLETLMQCLQDPEEKVYQSYPKSDGICLTHLRMALQEYAAQYPTAALFLRNHAVNRLAHWEQAMGEYIRKQAWQNRLEVVTDEDEKALVHTLAFFTGNQPSAF